MVAPAMARPARDRRISRLGTVDHKTSVERRDPVQIILDGSQVEVNDEGQSLLDALRDDLGRRAVKDGCSPQGQCGCCTVLVDGSPRVACVTPLKRVAGRRVTTIEGLDPGVSAAWADALCASGGSQCGFCTPGIVVRLAALRAQTTDVSDHRPVERALQAHLCRCTGWQTIVEAWNHLGDNRPVRDLEAAGRRATIEGRSPQRVEADVALGLGGFADDTAPANALVGLRTAGGSWVVGESVAEARRAADKVQGRRTTVESIAPLVVPAGSWDATLRTSWVEPAYLETDATWCEPGGTPASSLANGGAFGAKLGDGLGAVARELADLHGRPVRVLWSREDAVRLGAKRPPLAGGARRDGTGEIVVARTAGITGAIAQMAPGFSVTEVDVAGPPTSSSIRAAGWAEAVVLLAGAGAMAGPVRAPGGGSAEAAVVDGSIRARVAAGDPLDEAVLRAYAIGAAHMAYSWVTSEGLAVDDAGMVHDLTIRSFGVRRAAETPPIHVEIDPTPGPPVNGSDAVFAAVAAAVWCHQGCPPTWPTRQDL